MTTGRAHLGLGAEIAETRDAAPETIAAAARVCRKHAERARELGVERAQVIVTAPGRQGTASAALVGALHEATRLPVRILAADDEGQLAYEGAVASLSGDQPSRIAVVDVGGGSTELVVGPPGVRPDVAPLARPRLAAADAARPPERPADGAASSRAHERRRGPPSPHSTRRAPSSRSRPAAARGRSPGSSAASTTTTTPQPRSRSSRAAARARSRATSGSTRPGPGRCSRGRCSSARRRGRSAGRCASRAAGSGRARPSRSPPRAVARAA